MNEDYREKDYTWIKELLQYPEALEKRLDFFRDTSETSVPEDPIEKVIFQDRAKDAIRKIALNKGHILKGKRR
jgi:Lon-like ATP-dependent protease